MAIVIIGKSWARMGDNNRTVNGAVIFIMLIFLLVFTLLFFIILSFTRHIIHEAVICAALSTSDKTMWAADDSAVRQLAGALFVIAFGWSKRV